MPWIEWTERTERTERIEGVWQAMSSGKLKRP